MQQMPLKCQPILIRIESVICQKRIIFIIIDMRISYREISKTFSKIFGKYRALIYRYY